MDFSNGLIMGGNLTNRRLESKLYSIRTEVPAPLCVGSHGPLPAVSNKKKAPGPSPPERRLPSFGSSPSIRMDVEFLPELNDPQLMPYPQVPRCSASGFQIILSCGVTQIHADRWTFRPPCPKLQNSSRISEQTGDSYIHGCTPCIRMSSPVRRPGLTTLLCTADSWPTKDLLRRRLTPA